MITEQKKSGSYYTPEILSDFLIKHIFTNFIYPLGKQELSILEPSCGDGKFIKPIFQNKLITPFEKVSIEIRDTNQKELLKASKVITSFSNKKVRVKKSSEDFLFSRLKPQYDVVVGNPPYISKQYLSKEQVKKCKEVCNSVIPKLGEVKNIWTTFLLKSIDLLKDDGVLCFVLPSELLQVNYTKLIRKYLLEVFSLVEIFAFNELIFPDIEQDVIVLIGQKKKDIQAKNISFFQVNKLIDLKIPDYIKKHSNVHRKKLDKWTNYILTEMELNLIEKTITKNKLKPIKEYCARAEVGIVTAANNFFILTKEDSDKNKLNYHSKPILKKGSIIKNLIELSSEDFDSYKNKNYPVNFIQFKNVPFEKLGKFAKAYVIKGEELGLHKRYKMKLRENWYHIPSVWYSEALFMKRSHLYPRMIVTPEKILATDSFYRVVSKEKYNIKNITFSFYNTLTFVLAELEGRFYGGGVLELVPTEFKNLMIPYDENITLNQFEKLNTLFRNKKNIETILDFTDSILFPSMKKTEQKNLRNIWKKLLHRRLKK